MAFPLGDWQFWSVTAATVGAIWMLVKPFVGRGDAPPGPCASCPKSARETAARLGAGGEAGGAEGLVTLGKPR